MLKLRLFSFVAGLLLISIPHSVMADVDLGLSTIGPVVITPDGLTNYEVRIINTDLNHTPLQGASVTITFPPELADLLVLCDHSVTGVPPVFSAQTNVNGVATFNIKGAGCWSSLAIPGYRAQIHVDNVLIREVGVRSTKFKDLGSRTTAEVWCLSGHGSPAINVVTLLSDAVIATAYIATGIYHECMDINDDLEVGLTDAVAFTVSFSNSGTPCSEYP